MAVVTVIIMMYAKKSPPKFNQPAKESLLITRSIVIQMAGSASYFGVVVVGHRDTLIHCILNSDCPTKYDILIIKSAPDTKDLFYSLNVKTHQQLE